MLQEDLGEMTDVGREKAEARSLPAAVSKGKGSLSEGGLESQATITAKGQKPLARLWNGFLLAGLCHSASARGVLYRSGRYVISLTYHFFSTGAANYNI